MINDDNAWIAFLVIFIIWCVVMTLDYNAMSMM